MKLKLIFIIAIFLVSIPIVYSAVVSHEASEVNAGNLASGNFKVTGQLNVSGTIYQAGVPVGIGDGQWNLSSGKIYPGSLDYLVGIGTNNPSTWLEIVGTGYPGLTVRSTDAEGGDLSLQSSVGSYDLYMEGADLMFYDSADRVAFKAGGRVGINTTNPSSTLHVAGRGLFDERVGIGTNNPSNLLEVSGTGYPTISITSSDTKGGNLSFGSSSGYYSVYLEGQDLTFQNGAADTMVLYNSGELNVTNDVCIAGGFCLSSVGQEGGNWNISGSDLFQNDLSKNVGIGTRTPSNTLNVIGDANITTDLFVEGNATFGYVHGTTPSPVGTVRIEGQLSRIGIGTLFPAAPLDVFENDSGSIFSGYSRFASTQGSRGIGEISIGGTAANQGVLSYDALNGDFYIMNTWNDDRGDIIFRTKDSVDAGKFTGAGDLNIGSGDFFVNITSGDIGIGTVLPSTNLEIEDTSDAALFLEADTDDDGGEDGTAYVKFSQDGSQIQSVIGSVQAVDEDPEGGIYTDTIGNALLIGTINHTNNPGLQLGTDRKVRMTIREDGLVGINTTSPNMELTVDGNVNVTGDLFTNTNSVHIGNDTLTNNAGALQWGGETLQTGAVGTLSCTTYTNAANLQVTATCPGGTFMTGGSGRCSPFYPLYFYQILSIPSGNGWYQSCATTYFTATAYVRCCSVV